MVETYLYNTNSKNIVIPWSGGADSTLIILKVCKYLNKNFDILDNLNKVYLVSATSSQAQHKRENIARENILKYLKKKYKKVFQKVELVTFNNDFITYGNCTNKETLHQPYWWITSILGKFNNSTFLFGYHKGDDFWMMLDKADELINTSLKYLARENCSVYYPLARMYKDEILKELPERVLNSISYCERIDDVDEPCNTCGSCKTHNKFKEVK